MSHDDRRNMLPIAFTKKWRVLAVNRYTEYSKCVESHEGCINQQCVLQLRIGDHFVTASAIEFSPSGAKAQFLIRHLVARLKSCPDASCGSE